MSVRRWPIKPPVHDSASARVMPRDLSAAPIRASSDSVMPSRLQEDPDCIPSGGSESARIYPHPGPLPFREKGKDPPPPRPPPFQGEGAAPPPQGGGWGWRWSSDEAPPPSGSVDTARAALYP